MSNNNKFNENGNIQPISVYVRLRPFNESEEKSNVIQIANSRDVVVNLNNQKKFSFDGVFGTGSQQATLYDTIAKPLISEILSGYNCTVFAYGQTGTGKTYTMTEGISSLYQNGFHKDLYLSPSNRSSNYIIDEKSGLIPRVLTELFQELQNLQQQYTIRCSYLEIYNEDLRDLLSLNDDPSRLRIYDDQRNKGGVIIHEIEEITIYNTMDAMKLLLRGQEKRHTATTLMNDRSSRSHTIFTIIVHTREIRQDGEEVVKMGKINLVDLAGSENINRSGATDRRAREAGNINQSLLTLGRVIKSLSEKKSHIPFRESKLTRILQDSLGGKTKTSIIATISPCLTNLEETLSTLDYAHRARGITNKPETNERISQKKLLTQYVDQINRLQKDLHAARTGQGICLDSDNYEKLIIQQKTQKEELSQKNMLLKDLENQLRSLQDEKERREREWIETCVSFDQTRIELEKTKRLYEKTEFEKKEQEYLAQRYQENAEFLHEEAKGLLKMIKSSSSNESVLGEKVSKLYEITIANSQAVKRSCANMEDACLQIREDVTHFAKSSSEFDKKMANAIESIQQQRLKRDHRMESLNCMINNQSSDGNDIFDELLDANKINLEDFKETVTNHCKEYAESVVSTQDWSRCEIQSLHQLVLRNEEKRNHDLCKLDEILKSIDSVLSQRDFMSNLQDTQDSFLLELDVLIEDLQRRMQCTDIVSSEISKMEQDMFAMVEEEFDKIKSNIIHIKHQNWHYIKVAEEKQNILRTNFFTFKTHLENFVEKFVHDAFESKRLTHRRVQENFQKMVEGITNDSNNFINQVNNTHIEVQRTLEEEVNAIQKSFDETSSELLLIFSNMKSCGDEIYRRIEHSSQQSQHCNLHIGERLIELESQSEALSHK